MKSDEPKFKAGDRVVSYGVLDRFVIPDMEGIVSSIETSDAGVIRYEIRINGSDECYTEVHDNLKLIERFDQRKRVTMQLQKRPTSHTSIRFLLTHTDKRDLDELVQGLSASSRTKIDVAKLLRALCDVVLGCSEELMENIQDVELPCRPSNNDRKEMREFDRALAALIKRSIVEGGD